MIQKLPFYMNLMLIFHTDFLVCMLLVSFCTTLQLIVVTLHSVTHVDAVYMIESEICSQIQKIID